MEDRAQSAVRRSFHLFVTLGAINRQTQEHLDSIGTTSNEDIPAGVVRAMLIGIQAVAEAQTATADDAVSDWRDVAPGVVDSEVAKLREREGVREKSHD